MQLPQEGSVLPGHAATGSGPCRWLVSLDYDGTLRAEEPPHISKAFLELMQAWRPLGVRWGINTGRTLPYLYSELQAIVPCLPDFICTCERYIYLADANGHLQPETEHNQQCERLNLKLRQRLQPILHCKLAEIRRCHPELKWELAATDPLSIEAADSPTMDAIVPHLMPLTTPGIAIQRAGRYLRFADAQFSKGTALAYICRTWGIPQQRLFIMGDGHNDLHAFCQFPGAFCAAPADAHPEVIAELRQMGGYISPASGVEEALRTWYRERVLGRI